VNGSFFPLATGPSDTAQDSVFISPKRFSFTLHVTPPREGVRCPTGIILDRYLAIELITLDYLRQMNIQYVSPIRKISTTIFATETRAIHFPKM
jgi:hypothetical protein